MTRKPKNPKCPKNPKYLGVRFRDNDFGLLVTGALKKLYEIVADHSYSSTVAISILAIYKSGYLIPALCALIDSEHIAGKVETALRGLNTCMDSNKEWKPLIEMPTPPYKLISDPYKSVSDYLHIEVKLHETDAFSHKWDNGESAYLDLWSGGVCTF